MHVRVYLCGCMREGEGSYDDVKLSAGLINNVFCNGNLTPPEMLPALWQLWSG